MVDFGETVSLIIPFLMEHKLVFVLLMISGFLGFYIVSRSLSKEPMDRIVYIVFLILWISTLVFALIYDPDLAYLARENNLSAFFFIGGSAVTGAIVVPVIISFFAGFSLAWFRGRII